MLSSVDLTLSLESDEYKKLLVKYQAALKNLAYQVYIQQRSVIIIFEGWNAAGKGGAIRRIIERIDPRGFVVHRIDAPAGEEAAHHYLWRFWRHLPEAEQIAIFDHSWYRRVLTDRVEGLCSPAEWQRAYREINYFERQQFDHGAIMLKFWLHIDKDEQLRRFEALANDPTRSWKLTEQDWRDREKWDLYEEAANEMLLKTSTTRAPWTIIEGNSKPYARTKILETIADKLSEALDFDPYPKKAKKKKNKGNRKKK